MRRASETIYWDVLKHASGTFYMGMSEKGLVGLQIGHQYDDFVSLISKKIPNAALEHNPKKLEQWSNQLSEYYENKRKAFDLPVDLRGTDFQQSVWTALLNIPFGQTCTYSDIAQEIGNEKAVRAVGAACGANPLMIVVPCHRVVGKDGGMHGFAGEGGVSTKQTLLKHEKN